MASGEAYVVQVEPDGTRVVYLMPDDARRLLNSGQPCSVPWREQNMQLAANLGVQKAEPGINLAALQMAHWQATRPLSITEEAHRLRAANLSWWRR